MGEQLRPRGIAQVMNREARIAPGAVAEITGDDHVVERGAFALGHDRRFAAGAVHARQPPARDDLGLRDRLQVDDAEDVIGEAVEVRGYIGVTASRPPEPVDAQARHLEKRDLAHLGRL